MDAEPVKPSWEERISEEDWAVYLPVLQAAAESGVRLALGGAFALAAYTNHLRNTKDLDIYVLPSDRERMIGVIERCGMRDYYPQAAYDRGWIYRSCKEPPQIVDIIWSMPNRRANVDEQWLTRGPLLEIRGNRLRMLPAEELLWAKIYVVQRERCDWPDILNLLYHSGSSIDWERLLGRLGADAPLLAAVATVFRWLCPDRAEKLPEWLWKRLDAPSVFEECGRRSFLLDTRPWFGVDFRRWPDPR